MLYLIAWFPIYLGDYGRSQVLVRKGDRSFRYHFAKSQMSKANEYSQGRHPNSLANLNKIDGRPKQYESKKQRKNISVTQEGWEGIGKLAKQYGCANKSEFIEKLGRGLIGLEALS